MKHRYRLAVLPLLLCPLPLCARVHAAPLTQPPDAGSNSGIFDPAKVKRVDIRTGSGSVRLESVYDGPVVAEAFPRAFAPNCRLEMALRSGKLTLAARQQRRGLGLDNGDFCTADFTVRLPRAVELLIETGSGSVDGEGLQGPLRLRTGSGGVRLSWERTPVKGLIEADTGSGRVEFVFPSGTRADLALSSGSGSVQNNLQPDRKAKLRVRVRSGSGDIIVR